MGGGSSLRVEPEKNYFFPIRDLTFSLIQLPHPTPRLLRRSPPPTELIPNLHRPHEEVLRKRERDRVRDPVCAAIVELAVAAGCSGDTAARGISLTR